MNFLFISPRLTKKKNDLFGSGIPYWPIEAVYFVSWLEEKYKDIDCNILDLFSENIEKKEIKDDHLFIGENINTGYFDKKITSADCIFIYCISLMALSDIEETIKYIKNKFNNKKIILIENTQAVTSFSLKHEKERLFSIGANHIVLGELYNNWNEIIDYILNSKESTIKPQNILNNLDKQNADRIPQNTFHLSRPNWNKIKYYNYWKYPSSHGPKQEKYIPLLTSRGCPYGCDFCVSPEITARNWDALSPENVVEQIEYLKEKYEVDNFFVEDLNPTVQFERWDMICDLLLKQKLNISFFFVSGTKLETIKTNQLSKFSNAGCKYISFSPESGSSELMKIIGKKFDYNHGLEMAKNCKKQGIRTQACFVIGHPNERIKDFFLSLKYMIRLTINGLDEIAVFIISPFSGSKLSVQIENKKKNAIYSFSPSFRKGYIKFVIYRFIMIICFLITKLIFYPKFYIDCLKVLFNKKKPYIKLHNLLNR
jgi:anaerobic magnesium-protoporphyrin IX monomethyl ester cyclase